MTNVTICLTYFRSLALANLEAALFSVRYQDLSRVNSIVVIDNDTDDSIRDIQNVIDRLDFRIPVCFSSFKHRDSSRTHAWSTNTAVERAQTSWIFFTRADYLLEWGAVDQYVQYAEKVPEDWNGLITSHGFHVSQDIGFVNQTRWRDLDQFPALPGAMIDYSEVDTGVWMAPKKTFDSVEGLDERLTAWGHAQTHFQHKLHESGANFICIPKILYYHPLHSAERDLDLANRQLADLGVDLKQMWARHPGVY